MKDKEENEFQKYCDEYRKECLNKPKFINCYECYCKWFKSKYGRYPKIIA